MRFEKFFWLHFQTWNWRHFHFCSSFCDISRKATTATEMVDVICIIDFLHRATALFLFLCSHKVTEDLTWFSVELWPELANRETPVFLLTTVALYFASIFYGNKWSEKTPTWYNFYEVLKKVIKPKWTKNLSNPNVISVSSILIQAFWRVFSHLHIFPIFFKKTYAFQIDMLKNEQSRIQ